MLTVDVLAPGAAKIFAALALKKGISSKLDSVLTVTN